MFDLEDDLTVPPLTTARKRVAHDWLCLRCRKVSIVHTSCACGSKDFVPHLDRRPLLLDKEVRNGIMDLINQAATEVGQFDDVNDQLHHIEIYMPWLASLRDDAELAEERRCTEGAGYRTTNLSTTEILSLFKEMKLPPTS